MLRKRLIAIAGATLLAAPPFAVAGGPPTDPGHRAQAHAHRATPHADPPGPEAPSGTKARAYGRLCQKLSKKHIRGQKGTPFSQCVTAMAKLATGKAISPARACANLSKKPVAGNERTPYSKCLAAAANLGSEAGRS